MTESTADVAGRPKGGGESGHEKASQRVANGPIYVIVAFLGVTDAGLAYASSVTQGCTQVAVLIFLALYTSCVATMFFVILWNRNWVLYPPSEYGYPKPQDFVSAMRGHQVRVERLATDVRLELADGGTFSQSLADVTKGLPAEQRRTVLGLIEQMRKATVQRIEHAAVYVDASPLKGRGEPTWEVAYDADMRIARLLDHVLWRLQPYPPYPYGTMWVLRDKDSGLVFSEIGPTWAAGQGKREDDRTVSDVGIVGGMVLEVVNPSVG